MKVAKKASPSTSSSKSYKVIITDNFYKEAVNLQKKYPNIKSDFLSLKDSLKKSPEELGVSLGAGIRKVRMAITDKGQGKSGSARVIFEIKIIDRVVYVLSVYDKTKYDTVVTKKIKEMIAKGKLY